MLQSFPSVQLVLILDSFLSAFLSDRTACPLSDRKPDVSHSCLAYVVGSSYGNMGATEKAKTFTFLFGKGREGLSTTELSKN